MYIFGLVLSFTITVTIDVYHHSIDEMSKTHIIHKYIFIKELCDRCTNTFVSHCI